MRRLTARGGLTAVTVGLALLLGSETAIGRVKVRADFDKAFNFKSLKTWGWSPAGAGEVKMARSKEDDPDAVQARAEPVIKEAVAAEMPRRGLTAAEAQPDVTVHYYLLLTINQTAQTMGQFLPPVSAWGIPPFAGVTQSLEIVPYGSLVLDVSAKGTVVWRGVAEAKINQSLTEAKRIALLREAVRDLLKKFPPKP